jgi:hypothetical protein
MLKAGRRINRGDQNDKIIQVLAYAYMYETEAKSKPLRQDYLFKNLKSGFYRLISKKKKENMIINEEVMTNYLEQIVLLLNEILDVSIPFERKCSRVKKYDFTKTNNIYEFFKSTLVINLAVCYQFLF